MTVLKIECKFERLKPLFIHCHRWISNDPVVWNIPTKILYGDKDNLTSYETMSDFASKMGISLTVMNNGEHWFHTDEQMNFLDDWICESNR